MTSRVRVKEFGYRDGMDTAMIDIQINNWLDDQQEEIKIIDIKYHTQMYERDYDVSALVIYEDDSM